MVIEDIEDKRSLLIIKIPDTKTNLDKMDGGFNPAKIHRKYTIHSDQKMFLILDDHQVSQPRIWDCPIRKTTQAIASEAHQLLYWSIQGLNILRLKRQVAASLKVR
ncbi:hypothetical protein BDFB_012438 [Asbolus verrucosus]|uniref:Uncharacterized protein n=1 Tax=Asbolus verrucosus TaxID=1661398 RepID=A0A482W7D5_ASBVE|nr:hypothetical protein BDFB_012438 [Asbolus verrucosus]